MSTPTTINDLITSAVQAATAQSLGDGGIWRGACDALVNSRLATGLSFSSGEVAAILRTFDRTLRFSVSAVGERLRDGWASGEFLFTVSSPEVSYDDFGDPEETAAGEPLYVAADGSGTTTDGSLANQVVSQVPAEQISRYTEGLGRTPSGTLVFVYAPTYQAGEAHDFEVDIPRPFDTVVVNPTTGVPDVPVAHQSTRDPAADDGRRAAQVAKAASRGDLTCTVQSTGRMNLGRPVLENYALASRQGLQADARVFVWVGGDTQADGSLKNPTLTCRLADDPTNPATVSYQVFRGRTLVNLAKLNLRRPAGTRVTAEIDADGITLAL
jgi:hypothetical protein